CAQTPATLPLSLHDALPISGLALLYFLPALVAWINRRKNVAAITLLNLFLGWTFVGWVLPLVLACIPDGHLLQASLPPPQPLAFPRVSVDEGREIGRASCRERVSDRGGRVR